MKRNFEKGFGGKEQVLRKYFKGVKTVILDSTGEYKHLAGMLEENNTI